MPLIKDGAEIEDEWVFVEAQPDNPPPQAGEVLSAHQTEGASLSLPSLPPSERFAPTSPACGGGYSFSFDDFIANAERILELNVPVGVRLSPDSDPHELAPYLDRLGLIEVDFPKYVDGRGYSQAQLLRRRLDYKGELRAVGHVLLDQIFYMNRSGFDAYSTTRADLPNVLRALEEFSEVYQLAAAGRTSVFHKRHMAKDEIG